MNNEDLKQQAKELLYQKAKQGVADRKENYKLPAKDNKNESETE